MSPHPIPRGGRFCRAVWIFCSLLALALGAPAAVVINEILYRPGAVLPENPLAEFIELHNTGPTAVVLDGWQLTKGVSFTFPNVTLPAGEFLIVAAQVATFQANHPAVTNVVGGWTGTLSNRGEKIELSNAAGAIVDAVEYFADGDWAMRTRSTSAPTAGGWLWISPADSTGASLELRQPVLSRDRGPNWGSGPVGGTPGAANSLAATDVAPFIRDVTHSPPLPISAQNVTISCQLEDETMASVSASVQWRVSSTSPGPFSDAPMVAAGGGLYTAILPAQSNGAIIEFFVQASDGAQTRTWPAPTDEGQNANAYYQVTNAPDTGAAGHYRLIMSAADSADFAALPRSSDAEFNTTLIVPDAGEPGGFTVRYRGGTRIRGNSSRGYNPPPLRVEIPRETPWGDIERMNLNTRYPWSQVLGMKIMSLCGLAAPDARGAKVSLNGLDRAAGNTLMGGLHNHEEPIDARFLERHFPADDGGNLYQKRSATVAGVPRDRVRWGVANESLVRYTSPNWWVAEQWSKGSNESADDWSDLTAFVQTMHTAAGPTYKSQIEAKVNIEQWLRWLAVLTLLNDYETNLSNGIDDDYLMYRGELDPRFVLLPHDLDTILGQGDTTSPATGALFPFVSDETGIAGDDRMPQMNAFINHPEIRARYYQIVKELLNGPLAKAQFDATINNVLSGWASPVAINAMINYFDARRAYALGVVDGTLSAASALPVANGFPRTTSNTTTLTGTLDLSESTRVLVSGLDATINPVTGTWSRSGLSLFPGINRLTVQSLGVAGDVLETRTVDVWFDDGTTLPLVGPVTANTTLHAAGGPYLVSDRVIVAPGVTLTVEAGTNLWFAKNALLEVQGTLRVAGTEFAHARLCPNPTAPFEADPAAVGLPMAPPKSRGIRFLNTSSPQNLVQWLDVLHAQSTQGSIGVISSDATLDRVSFTGTHFRMVYASNAALTVQNSVFPNMFATNESAVALGLEYASEHVRSEGAPVRCLIRGNVFGTNKGRNAVLQLAGGTRPAPIVQVLDNVFRGSGDKALEISRDARIAGNVFQNVLRDPEILDGTYASAIAAVGPAGHTLMVVRNVFQNVDRAVHLRGGAAAVFENNTAVGVRDAPNDGAVINLFSTEPGGSAGLGAYAADNLFSDAPSVFGNADQPAGITSQLELNQNMLEAALAQTTISAARPQPVTTLGSGNFVADAHFADPARFTLAPDAPGSAAGTLGQDVGALVSPGIFVTDEPAAMTSSNTALLTVGGPGFAAFRWRLDDGPWSAEVPIGSGGRFQAGIAQVRRGSIALSGLAPGTHRVEVLGQDFAGNWQATPTISRSWTVTPGFSALRINEVLANNRSAVHVSGAFPDLIELHNPSATTIDLTGKTLSDDPAIPTKYFFPNGTSIAPGGYLVLFADSSGGGLHTGFALDAEGEGVYLFDDFAHGRALLDAVTFGVQAPDLSIGRIGANGAWKLNQPTLGSANRSQPLGNAARVRINEWLAASQVKFEEDFIELHNPETLPVALAGLQLSDEPMINPGKFVFRPLSFMAAGGFAVLRSSGPASSGTVLNFNLSAQYESLALSTANSTWIDWIDFANERNDIAQGRTPDGGPVITRFSLPTPGLPNIASGTTYDRLAALLAGLRISEVMYQPTPDGDAEFIEFINVGNTTLDLTGVRLAEAVEFTFGPVQLKSGHRILVARSISVMQSVYGPNVYALGPWSGRLDNSGETIRLLLPAPYEAAILSFTYLPSWAPASAGGGSSLELVNPNAAPVAWQNAASWSASSQSGGSPILLTTPVITSSANAGAISGDAFSYQILAAPNPETFSATGLPAGLALNPDSGLISGTLQTVGTFPIQLGATNGAGTGTKNLVLTVTASGPLAWFVWEPISGPKYVGQPFPTGVRAVDAQGRTVTSLNAGIGLSARKSHPDRSPIVVTELDTDGVDYFEFQNVSDVAVDTTGWFLVVNNATAGNINSVHNLFPALPNPMLPGQVAFRTDRASDGASYFGVNIQWPSANCWVMIVDGTGRIRDFVAVGYSAEQLATLGVIANGFALAPGTQWNSEGVATAENTAGNVLLRSGNADHNDASDWAWGEAPVNFGTANGGLTLPFPSTEESVAVSPGTLDFTAGVWSGNITMLESGASVRLRVDNGMGISSESAAFDVLLDTDSDGLPDDWESLYGFDPYTPGEAAVDSDGDGTINLDEFRAGSDPRNPASVLALTASLRVGADLTINWRSVPGRRYRVLGRAALDAGMWTVLTPTPVTATGASASWLHPGAFNSPAQFYRVEIAP